MTIEHYGCCIFWQDGPALLQESLRAMKANGLKVIAIDGCYKEFMKFGQIDKPYSTDGCIDVAKAEADVFLECPADGWDDQPTKRNAYVQLIPVGNYMWVIDADEMVRKCRIDFGLKEDVYRILESRMLSEGHRVQMTTVRIYKKYSDLGYKYQHSRIYRLDNHKEGDLASGLVVRAVEPHNMTYPILKDMDNQFVTIDHYNYKRTDERRRQKQNFYRMRKESTFPW